MTYVDGFVAAVPTANREAYIAHARDAVPMFRRYGALSVMETWGTDIPDGQVTSFPMAVKLEPGETVVFSWVTWPDKPTRDAAWEAIRNDPAMQSAEMPFDGKRMIYGGFEMVVEA